MQVAFIHYLCKEEAIIIEFYFEALNCKKDYDLSSVVMRYFYYCINSIVKLEKTEN